ncbi:hypothetical protein HCA93_10140 [Listeria innocua]|uniref:hypothetical protein n=1 Tax=Listeria innocua TaxID=1642 RepID=UPI001625E38A|nr:hypothetical protein [Listeria innocua]MBC2136660.1 hypothetical protein [Listeria innocua]
MGRPVKNKHVTHNFLFGVWTLEEFAQASPRTYGWWLDNIKDFPELAEFSNWATKNQRETWAFDAVKANNWLIKKFVYKEV